MRRVTRWIVLLSAVCSACPMVLADFRDEAPPRAALRQPIQRPLGAPAVLTSDDGSAPRRLRANQRALHLAPQTSKTKLPQRTGEAPQLLTGAASLGIVLGLFLLVAWAVRRGMPNHSTLVPRGAVEILGRVPLVGRQQAHLVRCGNKVLLLSVSAASVETITEITDPAEVDRLTEICQQAGAKGLTASVRQVFGQFSRARGQEYLPGDDVDDLDFSHLEAGSRQRV